MTRNRLFDGAVKSSAAVNTLRIHRIAENWIGRTTHADGAPDDGTKASVTGLYLVTPIYGGSIKYGWLDRYCIVECGIVVPTNWGYWDADPETEEPLDPPSCDVEFDFPTGIPPRRRATGHVTWGWYLNSLLTITSVVIDDPGEGYELGPAGYGPSARLVNWDPPSAEKTVYLYPVIAPNAIHAQSGHGLKPEDWLHVRWRNINTDLTHPSWPSFMAYRHRCIVDKVNGDLITLKAGFPFPLVETPYIPTNNGQVPVYFGSAQSFPRWQKWIPKPEAHWNYDPALLNPYRMGPPRPVSLYKIDKNPVHYANAKGGAMLSIGQTVMVDELSCTPSGHRDCFPLDAFAFAPWWGQTSPW